MIRSLLLSSTLLLAAASNAHADGFQNGGFETGSASGWTQGGGYRGAYDNSQLSPGLFTPGDGGARSSVISAGTIDPNVGSALGSTVLNGAYSYRVENTFSGGYASVLSQQVSNYTDASIYFAWKAVLQGAHGVNDAATMLITLKDITTGNLLINRQYNAADGGGGVDPRFAYLNGNYYTADWQLEQISIGSDLAGHDFLLSVLAADCEPTGHFGYVYIDGFGSVAPPGTVSGVPEPGTWALMILGFGGVGSALRNARRRSIMARI
jgi:hypothetical protein